MVRKVTGGKEGILYLAPRIPGGLQVRWISGVHLESTWNTLKMTILVINYMDSTWSSDGILMESTRSSGGVFQKLR
jgi:hypothetical protein